ncbi:Rne/Rng family ribonuclease, partial [bacterium]|nr:Rne/Rng family ribonuclease [bacterium]
MKKEILVSVSPLETRVATLEDGDLVEIMTEAAGARHIVGNIYKGRVSEVLPGLQAAFIDIGFDRNAFLHAEDLVTDVHDIGAFLDEDYDNLIDHRRGRRREVPPIEKILSKGQDILVQITKEPIGKKGPRATANITLAGRYLVLMPYADHVGVSRKISSTSERNRLRKLVKGLRTGDAGFIVRTVGEGSSKKALRAEMGYLSRLSREIVRRAKKREAPALVYDDLGLVFSIIRDVLSEEVDSLVIDDRELYNRIRNFARRTAPKLSTRIELYSGRFPLLEAYGVERELERMHQRRIWLKCGGYIVIEQTEALTSIDVNTGKFVGKTNLERTVFETNLEAAVDIPRQLRLRDIGGIIIIDFIDMEVQSHRDEVVKRLNKALQKDRSKTRVRRMSDLGLVEMTRKRVRRSVTAQMTNKCPCCGGVGLVLSDTPLALHVENTLRRVLCQAPNSTVQLVCNPHVVQLIKNKYPSVIGRLQEEFGREIILQSNPLQPFDELTVKGA